MGNGRCKEEEGTVPALVKLTEDKRETVKIVTQRCKNKPYKCNAVDVILPYEFSFFLSLDLKAGHKPISSLFPLTLWECNVLCFGVFHLPNLDSK